MPRKTKDVESELKNNETLINQKESLKKKTNSNSDVKKASTSKKTSAKKQTTASKKSTTSKKSSLTSKSKKSTQKATKSTSTTTRKKASSVKSKAKTPTPKEILEYYDLPYRYNETIVKILAQTPKKLFIYWDISDDDRKNYIDTFGLDFFNNTVPVLIIHNETMNYTFEIEVNDFANCWYLDINDSKCKYNIELGRRSKKQDYYIPNNYIYVTSSNEIESPNDHILFEKQSNTVYFRNVKNNNTYSKDIANLSFIRNMGKIYNIYDTYKELYNKIYNTNDFVNDFSINNPSSSSTSSTFK